jgi:hypothetical protein
MRDNDGRKVVGYLAELEFADASDPVVQVVREADQEVLYTMRVLGNRFRPHVFAPGKYTVKVGNAKPDKVTFTGMEPVEGKARPITVTVQ